MPLDNDLQDEIKKALKEIEDHKNETIKKMERRD
jgi:hypothetical protein